MSKKKYLDFRIRNHDWCIIRLKDGAKLRIMVILTAVIAEDNKPAIVGTHNVIAVAHLPENLWGPPSEKRYTPEELEEGIIEEDMEFTVEKDPWNVYEVEDGTVISIKPYVVKVSKTKYYTERGEPIYVLNIQPIVKTKKPKKK